MKNNLITNHTDIPTLDPTRDRISSIVLGGIYGSGLAYTNSQRPSYDQLTFPKNLYVSSQSELGLYLNDSLTEISSLSTLRIMEPLQYKDSTINKSIVRVMLARYLSRWIADENSLFQAPEYVIEALMQVDSTEKAAIVIQGYEYAQETTDSFATRGWIPLWHLAHNQSIAVNLLQAQITHSHPIALATLALYNSYIWHNSRNLGPGQYRTDDFIGWGIEQCFSLANVFYEFTEIKLSNAFNTLIDNLNKLRKELIANPLGFVQIDSGYDCINDLLTALTASYTENNSPEEALFKTVLETKHNEVAAQMTGELLGSLGATFPDEWYNSLPGYIQDKIFHAILKIDEARFRL